MFTAIAYADSFDAVLSKVNANIINPAIEFAFIIATVIFLWGVLQFIWNAGDDKKRQEGKDHIVWGLIGFVIMFCVYGIITILANSLGVTGLMAISRHSRRRPCSKYNFLRSKAATKANKKDLSHARGLCFLVQRTYFNTVI